MNINVLESSAAKSLIRLYERGAQLDWLGGAGDSVSRWLTPAELLAVQSELDFSSNDYIPLNLTEPRLARECIMYCCHGDAMGDMAVQDKAISLKILQVNATGDQCRVLWEAGEAIRPPLEISLHLTCHAARSTGAGDVVYHCQPLNTLALVALTGEDEGAFFDELVKGYSAIISMLPDGIGVIPQGMKIPLRIGERMTPEMYEAMERFILRIREHISHQEALVLRGEGLICASHSERDVLSIISAIERAATIRLKTLYARQM